MRFKFTLSLHTANNTLPQSYAYEISEWLYSVFSQNEQEFSDWLAVNELQGDSKDFQGFCFSQMTISDSHKWRERLIVDCSNVSFLVSFLPEKNTESLVRKMFENKEGSIGDFLSKMDFIVTNVERIETPSFHSCRFKTLSPVMVQITRDNEKKMSISPETSNYDNLLFQNLKEKYRIYYGQDYEGSNDFSFRVLQPSLSHSFIIKAGTKKEGKMRGFNTTFQLEADERLLSIGYEAGFGESNSWGFGMTEVVPLPR